MKPASPTHQELVSKKLRIRVKNWAGNPNLDVHDYTLALDTSEPLSSRCLRALAAFPEDTGSVKKTTLAQHAKRSWI